jgi:FdhD protein
MIRGRGANTAQVSELEDPRGRAELRVDVQKLDSRGDLGPATDWLATEEPLEIRLGGSEDCPGTPVAVAMRTPGADFDLAWGLAVTEALVAHPDDIVSAHWGAPGDGNAVELRLRSGLSAPAPGEARPWLVNSACGLCGKDTIEAVTRTLPVQAKTLMRLAPSLLVDLPDRLRTHQEVFESTGGLHGAGAFSFEGEALSVKEDIGRHNAVDKVVGHLARSGRLPATDLILVVSGRSGFEIVQKAAVAGFNVLVSVSAPSALAVQLARDTGMTLAGFVRQGRANIYSAAHRLS